MGVGQSSSSWSVMGDHVVKTDLAVGFVANVDGVVLAVGADAPGAEEPPPARDAVLAQRAVEDELVPVDVVVDVGLLEYAVEIDLEVVADVP